MVMTVVIGLLSVALSAFALYYLLDLSEWRRTRLTGRGRRIALAETGRRLGLSFEADARGLVEDAPFLPFPLFGVGHDRAFENALTGKLEGAEVRLFDYRYDPGDREGILWSPPLRLTVCAVGVYARLPEFTLSPEGPADRLREAMGETEIDFEDDPAFSRRYFLQGEDAGALRAALGEPVRRFLAANEGWFLQGGGYWLLAWRSDRRDARVPAAEIERFLHAALAIARLFEREA